MPYYLISSKPDGTLIYKVDIDAITAEGNPNAFFGEFMEDVPHGHTAHWVGKCAVIRGEVVAPQALFGQPTGTTSASIFETDERLRDLMRLEPIVRHAGTLAQFDGNDTEALIVALLVLTDAERAYVEAQRELLVVLNESEASE